MNHNKYAATYAISGLVVFEMYRSNPTSFRYIQQYKRGGASPWLNSNSGNIGVVVELLSNILNCWRSFTTMPLWWNFSSPSAFLVIIIKTLSNLTLRRTWSFILTFETNSFRIAEQYLVRTIRSKYPKKKNNFFLLSYHEFITGSPCNGVNPLNKRNVFDNLCHCHDDCLKPYIALPIKNTLSTKPDFTNPCG